MVTEEFSLSEDGPESKRKFKASTPSWRVRQESKTEVGQSTMQVRRNRLIRWSLEAVVRMWRDLWLSL